MLSVVRKVCELYSLGNYTLESCCENAGVPYRTFRNWWSMYERKGSNDGSRWAVLAEVADLWAASQVESREIRDRELVERAEKTLLKRVEGFYNEDTETFYKMLRDKLGNETPVLDRIKKTKKYIPPSDRAIQFVLTKLCPEKYNGLVTDKKISEPVDMSNYKDWTIEELDVELDRVKKRFNNS